MGKYGRKAGVLYAAVLSIIGGTFVAASQNVAMFIAFRFVAGAGSGLLQVCMWTSNYGKKSE
jgi:fucose permease